MATYNHKDIESAWQKKWEEEKLYATHTESNKTKWFGLVEFPYPSGAGLHVGHVRSYTGMDILARKRRMQGYEVLFPIGWDAFGLPAENYAIKTGIHPSITTRENIETFRRQLKACGFSFDWDREVDTTDPLYYKWTQWIFLQLYMKGLAYKKEMPVNWCPKDKCVLANEEVVDGACERCGTQVEKKNKEQWMLGIAKYAERLDKDLDETTFLEKIKIQQRNWIGMSEGSEIDFGLKINPKATFKFEDAFIVDIKNGKKKSTRRLDDKGLVDGDVFSLLNKKDGSFIANAIVKKIKKEKLVDLSLEYDGGTSYSSKKEQLDQYKKYYGESVTLDTIFSTIDFVLVTSNFTVFTTRADTLFGCTYCVLAPEHPLVQELLEKGSITNSEEVKVYKENARLKTDIDRSAEGKEKTGVKLEGVMAINPGNQEEAPVFIADYVLPGYGTGAIMAVPAHDERDYQFAKKYSIPIVSAIEPVFIDNNFKPSENVVERFGIVGIIKKWDEDKYLGLRWKKVDWETFLTGGLEEGEEAGEALKREILEETGYKNIKNFKEVNVFHSFFYHTPKKENRHLFSKVFYCELKNGETKNLSEEEMSNHELSWLSQEELKRFKLPPAHLFSWNFLKNDGLYTDDGILTNSLQFSGLRSDEARIKITEAVGGRLVKKSKMRDWVFARQRYWGEPIPLVYDNDGRMYPVHESNLPITLPQVDKYEPTDNGESPLYQVPEWVHVKGYVDEDGFFHADATKEEVFRRETDTMPQWAGSSWYFMRYIDPKNDRALGEKEMLSKWLPVDWYNGGMEHTTLHLLYSRFWYKFLFDIGLVPTSEPYYKRTSQGMILGDGGVKMSKSLGNVVNPDDIIKEYGADTLRLYEMFIGPFDQAVVWNSQAVSGVRRFLDKIYSFKDKVFASDETLHVTHQMVKKVTEDIETMSFNTCVSQMMIWANAMEKEEKISKKDFMLFLCILAPFAPHIAEELWQDIGAPGSVHGASWPEFDPEKLFLAQVTMAFQVSGKLRGTLDVARDAGDEEVIEIAKNHEIYQKYVGKEGFKKIIVVKNKIVNIVI